MTASPSASRPADGIADLARTPVDDPAPLLAAQGVLLRLAAHLAQALALLAHVSIRAPVIESKILLGDQLGEDGALLARVVGRLRDLALDVDGLALADLAALGEPLDHRVVASDAPYHLDAPAVLQDLSGWLDHGHSVLERPTAALLREARDQLTRHVAAVRAVPDPTFGVTAGRWMGDPFAADGMPLRPERDDRFLVVDEGADLTGLGVADASGDHRRELIASLHANLMVFEIPSIEVCSRNLVVYSDLPVAFALDMASQVGDEARHASALCQRIAELGGDLGVQPVDHRLWHMTTDQPVELVMAIHQCVGESIGVDGGFFFSDAFDTQGDAASRDLFTLVTADEIRHVAIGNRWLRRIAPDRVAEVLCEAVAIRARHGEAGDQRPFPVVRWAQERAGFPPAELSAMEARSAG